MDDGQGLDRHNSQTIITVSGGVLQYEQGMFPRQVKNDNSEESSTPSVDRPEGASMRICGHLDGH